jgi:hypothetical protein
MTIRQFLNQSELSAWKVITPWMDQSRFLRILLSGFHTLRKDKSLHRFTLQGLLFLAAGLVLGFIVGILG